MTDNPLKTSYPIFEAVLPASGRKLSCRPYLVKEDRILLMAKESGKAEDISQAVSQIIRNCVLDKDFELNSLSVIDIDYLFLRLRAEAVGNSITVSMICNNIPDGQIEECGGEFQFKLDVNQMKPNRSIESDIPEQELTDVYVVKFRYPSFEKMRTIKSDDPENIQIAKRVQAVIEYVATKGSDDEGISFDDVKIEFIDEWIEGLTTEQFDKINSFIENIPAMTIHTEATCPKCGFKHEGDFDNLMSFFP